MKKGFTIVELLMVIGVIAVLMGIVTTVASESMKASRDRRTTALCELVQAGLAAYYAQNDEWPNFNPKGKTKSNTEGADGDSDSDIYVLDGSEVKNMILKLVEEARDGNPLMDISGLWVSGTSSGEKGTRGYGMSFLDAIHGTRYSRKRLTSGQMTFGYPDPATGYFRRFKITYSISTDQMTVSKQD